MKILLDECLPKRLKHEMGWAGKKNGQLLQLMLEQFDVFITVDRNLKHQQQLRELKIAFIVLVAADNRFETLQPLIPLVLEAIQEISPGSVIEIAINDESD
jgi:hypothetical protein